MMKNTDLSSLTHALSLVPCFILGVAGETSRPTTANTS